MLMVGLLVVSGEFDFEQNHLWSKEADEEDVFFPLPLVAIAEELGGLGLGRIGLGLEVGVMQLRSRVEDKLAPFEEVVCSIGRGKTGLGLEMGMKYLRSVGWTLPHGVAADGCLGLGIVLGRTGLGLEMGQMQLWSCEEELAPRAIGPLSRAPQPREVDHGRERRGVGGTPPGQRHGPPV